MTTMLYPQEDGKLVEIPDEHAAVLALYRDRMPLVFEVQEWGPPMLYPLIDVDEEPIGTPRAGALETHARRAADYLKAKRLGGDPIVPDFERLAGVAIRAYVEDMGVLAGSLSHDDGPAAVEQSVKEEMARTGRRLRAVVDKAVHETKADLVKNWGVTA